MTSPVNVDIKPGANELNVDEGHPHTVVRADADKQVLELLVKTCPAGLYKRQDDGSVCFDYAGCLECGTCRILGLGSALEQWKYPRGIFGVKFRYDWCWLDMQYRTDSHCKKIGITHTTAQKL